MAGASPDLGLFSPTVTQPDHPPRSSVVPALRPGSQIRPFERFGRLVQPVTVAREGTLWSLGRWIALNRRAGETKDQLWRRCREANGHWFETYEVVRLAESSFFLPAGEVVFKISRDPSQIRDNSPAGVMMRHLEAISAFPNATTYFLEPVFVTAPDTQLCSVDELRLEAELDACDAFGIASLYGPVFRSMARVAAIGIALRSFGQRITKRAIQMMAAINRRRLHRLSSDILDERPTMRHHLEQRAVTAESMGLEAEARRFRLALAELQSRVSIDPILCFELPNRPGELWFEAHWFVGSDERTYVHY